MPSTNRSGETEPPQAATQAAGVFEGLPAPRRYFAFFAVMSSLVLVVIDSAIANVALPTIHDVLGASAASTVWVVTAYQLALVMCLLPCAALGEKFGHFPIFMGGVLLFTTASAICAMAPSLPWLVAARFLQGLGAAPIMALASALLRFTFPHRMMGRVIGWNAMVIALSLAIGPTIGAAILSVASWPWLFAVNIPVGLVVLIAGRALPRPEANHRRFDLRSVALNAAGFGCLVIGADKVIEMPFAGGALLALGAICFAALIRREWPLAAPLIPLDLLRRTSFRLSVIASICCFSAQMASFVALPFLLQHGLGLSTFMTGLCMTPWPLMIGLVGPISGRLSDRMHGGILCAAGGGVLCLGLVLAATWPLQSDPLPLVIFTLICGFGFGLFQVPNNRNMLVSIPRTRSGAAGGMQGTARLVGQTIGGLTMSLLFTLVDTDMAPREGLAIGATLALCGAIASALRLRAPAESQEDAR